ncbi:hypothetical protein HOLleu_35624 [Holothuria leucospilota]|uniref:Uncharacterized protein n=1 Tax=Holothuria leucospilota TaxID=206669 RepID=A0A9Q0YIR1_HOLLE|nr:hypothetical protein HOLleu_35624 [Holothuria leucospilota]
MAWRRSLHHLRSNSPELSNKTCIKEIRKASLLEVTCDGTAAAAVICLPALPALPGPASSLALAEEGGAVGFTITATGAATAAPATDYATLKLVYSTSSLRFHQLTCNAEMKGCSGGKCGTWLVLRGGLQGVKGYVKLEKLRLQVVDSQYILGNGEFTTYSSEKFCMTDEAKNHKAAGHSCSGASCKLLS